MSVRQYWFADTYTGTIFPFQRILKYVLFLSYYGLVLPVIDTAEKKLEIMLNNNAKLPKYHAYMAYNFCNSTHIYTQHHSLNAVNN